MPEGTLLRLLAPALLLVPVALWYLFWGRKSRFTIPKWPRLGRSPSSAPTFIGREAEQQRFLELVREPQSKVDLLIVSGARGAGKRSLLARFRERCQTEKTPILCGPILDLTEPQQIEDLLEKIVRDLEEQVPSQSFSDFNAKLTKYQDTAAGRTTGAERALGIARGVAAGAAGIAGTAGVPGATLAKSAIESSAVGEALELAKDAISGHGDLKSVTEAFFGDLLKLAASQPTDRLVLLFDNLYSRLDDRDVRWLRYTLVPRIVKARSVLLVATTEDPQQLHFGQEIGREVKWLGPFEEADSRRYVKEIIGIENPRLSDEITKRSNGLPQKLDYYRAYFEAKPPEIRLLDHLSDDAEAWVVSGDVNQLLQQVKSEYLRKVIVTSSPLRWFNAELLQTVADKAGLAPAKDEAQANPSSLLELGRRPSWITQTGGGWGIELEQRRRDFIEEFRRFNRTQHSQIHELGAKYHHRRLLAFEEQAAAIDGKALGDPDIFRYVPESFPSKRFEDPDYNATLAEWLYHILALASEKAFPLVADIVGETLIYDFDNCSAAEPCNAERLLQIGPELSLPKRQRLYLDLLTRAAFALRQSDHQEAIRVLRALTSAGAPTRFLKPVILFLLGACHWQLGQEPEAVSCFEDVDTLFSQGSGADLRAIRVKCINATWLAYSLARRDQAAGQAIDFLVASINDATEKLKDDALVGELERARALIMVEVVDLEGAKKGYEKALASYERAGLPTGAALVRRDLSRLLSQQDDDEGARQELDQAAAIYGYLADRENQAIVAVEKMRLYLKVGDNQKAEEQKDEALKLGNDRVALLNLVGISYYGAQRFEEAAKIFQQVIDRAETALYRANLADALSELGKHDEAIKEIEKARALSPNDRGLLLQHALLSNRTENKANTDLLFGTIESQRRKDVAENPKRAALHAALGALLFLREKYGESEKAYREAVTLEGQEASYHFELGRSLLQLEKPNEDGAREFIVAARLAPGRTYLGSWIVSAVTGLEQELAIALLEEATQLLPQDDDLHYQLGTLLRQPVADQRPTDKDELKPSSSAAPEQSSPPVLGSGGEGTAPASEPETAPAASADVELTPREKSLLPGRESRTNAAVGTAVPDIRNLQTIGQSPIPGNAEREKRALEEFQKANEIKPTFVPYLLKLAEVFIDRREWERAEKYILEASKTAKARGSTLKRLRELRTRIQRKESWYRESNMYPVVTPIAIEVAPNLEPWVGETDAGKEFIDDMLGDLRHALLTKLGVRFPGIRVRVNTELNAGACVVLIHEVPRYLYLINGEYVAGASPEECRIRAQVEGAPAVLPWSPKPGTWVEAKDIATLEEHGIDVWELRGFLVAAIGHVLELHAADFVGIQEVSYLIDSLAESSNEPSQVTDEMLPRLRVVLRRLLQETVSIADLATIIDEFLKADKEADVIEIGEKIRRRLFQAPSKPGPWRNGLLRVGELTPAFEKEFFFQKGRIEKRGRRSFLRMGPEDLQEVLALLRNEVNREPDVKVLLVNDAALRPYLRSLLEFEFPYLQVFSQQELGSQVQLERAFFLNPPI